MNILYVSLAIDVLLTVFTIYWLIKKSYKTDKEVLASLNEAPVTVILAVFSLGLSYFLVIAKWLDAAVAGTDQTSYLFIGGFSVVCSLLGGFMLLYTYTKKYILLKDRMTVVNVIGSQKDIYWRDIKAANIPMLSKNLKLKTEHGSCTLHSGNIKQYKNFIKNLKNFIPNGCGAGIVNELYNRL